MPGEGRVRPLEAGTQCSRKRGVRGKNGVNDYIVGIDLGTSNSALAYIDRSKGADAPIVDFPIMQTIRAFDVRPQALLPSALYLQHPDELTAGAYALPWDPSPPQIIGEFARWHGSKVPSRLITSAKSWL